MMISCFIKLLLRRTFGQFNSMLISCLKLYSQYLRYNVIEENDINVYKIYLIQINTKYYNMIIIITIDIMMLLQCM